MFVFIKISEILTWAKLKKKGETAKFIRNKTNIS